MSYTPSISQGVYPEDAGWTNEGNTTVLLLSVPLLTEVLSYQIDTFDYAWLYDGDLDAYIFCFRLDNKKEFAIIFHKDHAGKLLKEKESEEEFSLVITDQPFKGLSEDTPYVTLSNISFVRQTIAGW